MEPSPDIRQPDRREPVNLRLVRVRPIGTQDRPRWDDLVRQYHYLGFKGLPGESLRYVAEFEGEWLALLGWGSSAFKFGARDRWIGWTPEQQWKRLRFVTCNQRFLILPGCHIPNLASRVLSLNLKRLRQDWEEFHGHPVLLAETFVDQSRFSGVCYRAGGWVPLGQSRGFGRNAGRYFHHGQPKTIFVYPLVKNAQGLLSSAFLPPELQKGGRTIVDLNSVQLDGEGGLLGILAEVRDPRKPRGIRHAQVSILAVAACACLSGARSFAAIAQWAANLSQPLLERLGCSWNFNAKKYVAPSEPTLRRTLQSVDPDEMDQRIGAWLATQSNGDAVAVDGKTVRGSRGGPDGKAVHLMSALLHEEGVVVSQKAVSEKSNEITAMKPLLDPLELTGKIITADALHAQVEHARYIVENKKADYLFTVKANQPGLLEDIQGLDDANFFPCASGEVQRARSYRI